jgi:hypothetical protein
MAMGTRTIVFVLRRLGDSFDLGSSSNLDVGICVSQLVKVSIKQ